MKKFFAITLGILLIVALCAFLGCKKAEETPAPDATAKEQPATPETAPAGTEVNAPAGTEANAPAGMEANAPAGTEANAPAAGTEANAPAEPAPTPGKGHKKVK